MRKYILLVSSGLASMLMASPVLAQSAAGPARLEEVVVTARKMAESLQDVPVAVAAISAEDLANNNAVDLTKVAELAPQVLIGAASSGTGALISIRGISSSPSNAGFDQSVSVSIDGMQISRGRVLAASLFDIQQVEILQGPQALFFGKNSPAGVVSVTSKDPTSERDGYLKGGYEFVADEAFIEGAVSAPLTDTLKMRIAARGSWMKGWIRNVAQPVAIPFNPGVPAPGATSGRRLPDGRDLAARLTLLWEPTDDFDARLKLTYNTKHQNGAAATGETYCTGGQTIPVSTGTVPIPGGDCEKNRRVSITSLPAIYAANLPYGNGGEPYQKSEFFLGTLAMNKRLGGLTLSSNTGFYRQTTSGSLIGDSSTFARVFALNNEYFRAFTQEFRANTDFDGPVNVMVGAFFEDFRRPWYNAADFNHTGVNPATGNWASVELATDTHGRSYSFFGQVRWNIIPSVELAAGARYTKDRKRSRLQNIARNPTTPMAIAPTTTVLQPRYEDDNISPEVTLSWKPAQDQLVYAAYKTGYKSGGVSTSSIVLPTDTNARLIFDNESVKGFEAGYKADLFDNRLRLNLVAYRYKYTGLQVTAFDSSTLSFRTLNAASARTKGVTAQMKFIATNALTIDGSVGYNRSFYLSFPNSPCYAGQTAALGCLAGPPGQAARQNLNGVSLNRAPKLTAELGANYKAELADGWRTDFSVSGSYTSSYQTQADNNPGGEQSSFWRLNAAVRISPPSGDIEVSIIGRNLTNSYYMLHSAGHTSSGNTTQFLGFFNRPREVVVQAMYRF